MIYQKHKIIMKLKYIIHLCGLILFTLAYSSCDLVQSPDSTADVQEGFITYPSLTLKGAAQMTINVGGSFEDPGFDATLGQDDVKDQVEITGSVDASKPGIYPINYALSVTNELDDQSTVTATRFVAVVNEEIDDIDLSGTYLGDGSAISGAWNLNATVSSTGRGWYQVDRALASGNNLSIFFAIVDKSTLIVPNQSSPFGSVNTTGTGTSATITDSGFEWTLFISCCGNFGPIIFTKT
jgi:hypothetical protein